MKYEILIGILLSLISNSEATMLYRAKPAFAGNVDVPSLYSFAESEDAAMEIAAAKEEVAAS